MKHLTRLFMTSLLLASSTPLFAATPAPDIQTAFSALEDDFKQVSNWINKQQTKSIAFASAGSVCRPAGVKSLPGFEIGVSAGASIGVDPNLISELPTYAVSANFLALPSFFFTPTGLIHGKVGLFKLPGLGKVDLGAAFSNYSIHYNDEFSGSFGQWQIEARLQLLDGNLLMPVAMSLNVGAGNAKGNFIAKHHHTEEIASIDYNGTSYAQNLDIDGYMSSDWDVTSYFAKLIISKNLIFITPYAGVGIQASTGKVNTVVGADGTLTLTPPSPFAQQQETIGIKGSTNSSPREFDYRLLAGAQITVLPFIGLNLAAEYGQDVYAFSTGLVISIL